MSTRRLIILAVLVLLVAIGANAYFAKKATNENKERINEIRASRVYSVKLSCVEENERHDKAGMDLNLLVAKTQTKKLTPKETARQKVVLALLVDAFVPRYNCQERLRKYTQQGGKNAGTIRKTTH